MASKKIRVISDLHYNKYPDINDLFEKLDFYFQNVDKENEILIVAGDIGIATQIDKDDKTVIAPGFTQVLKYLKSRWNKIIYVAGNHEYYTSKESVININNLISNECERFMIDYLNKDIIEIDGYIFMGCVLWSPMEKDVFENLSSKNWSFINYDDLIELNKSHIQWIENNLEKFKIKSCENDNCFNDKIIVITHYLPSFNLLHKKYRKGQYANTKSAYVNSLDNLIYKYNRYIPFWFFGHSHLSRFHRFENTLAVNPGVIGNPWEDGECIIYQGTFDLK